MSQTFLNFLDMSQTCPVPSRPWTCPVPMTTLGAGGFTSMVEVSEVLARLFDWGEELLATGLGAEVEEVEEEPEEAWTFGEITFGGDAERPLVFLDLDWTFLFFVIENKRSFCQKYVKLLVNFSMSIFSYVSEKCRSTFNFLLRPISKLFSSLLSNFLL